MIMHVITNFTARAGAEAMLFRLLRGNPAPSVVVSLLGVADHYRRVGGAPVRFVPLEARSAVRLLGVPRLAGVIRDERPDAIVCWMYHAMVAGTVAARLAGTDASLFWNVRQSLDDPTALSRSTRFALSACRTLSGIPNGIIFNSARAAHLHRQFGFANARTEIVPNGFEATDALPPPVRAPLVFGIAARFHRQKDHSTFFRAAALLSREHPGVRFVAAGAGMHAGNPQLQEIISKSGVPPSAVTLLGELEEMQPFYRDIDVLVLSSRTEGFPNVLGEAMGCGRLVITTDVGDAAALVGDTGIVVPADDAHMLAAGMARMHALSHDAYCSMAAAARRRINEHYSMEGVARRFRAFLNDAPSMKVEAKP